jgi:glycerophosphoryl diester phosphodiesterase
VTDVYAHRGLHASAPENTVAAFLEARAAGADGVELDVRRTRDGALVIHHDAELAGVGAIAQLDCRQLPTQIPTLAEAMSACADLRVNVEIKNDATDSTYDSSGALAHQVVTALVDLERVGDVVISSFDLPTCEAVRRWHASVEVGWLIDWRAELGPTVDVAVEYGLSAVHPFFHRVDAEYVAGAHARGLAVNVWTVNDPDQMTRMFDLGVDVLITDEVAAALALASARAN